jgi:hypothetical protein
LQTTTPSHAYLDAIHAAAAPLDPRQRDAFKAAVLAALAEAPELGPGVVHRTIRETQRQFRDPPTQRIEPRHGASSKLSRAPAIWASAIR